MQRRKRVLSGDELAALLPILRASRRPYAPAMMFMLLTLTRRQETAMARWRDVNLEAATWTIPETKNGETHIVPLSKQAIDLLRSRLSIGESGTPTAPNPDTFLFATSSGSALLNWDRETKTLQRASGTGGWTRHDLRRTGATMLGNMARRDHHWHGGGPNAREPGIERAPLPMTLSADNGKGGEQLTILGFVGGVVFLGMFFGIWWMVFEAAREYSEKQDRNELAEACVAYSHESRETQMLDGRQWAEKCRRYFDSRPQHEVDRDGSYWGQRLEDAQREWRQLERTK